MVKISLNVMERLLVLNILPKEHSYATLKIIRELQDTIGITEKEFEYYEIKQDANKITWNEKAKELKEFEIGFKANQIIKEELSKLDDQKKLDLKTYELYEKFVEGSKDADN